MKLTTATQIYPQREADSDNDSQLLCILLTIKIVSILEALCFTVFYYFYLFFSKQKALPKMERLRWHSFSSIFS